MSDGRDHPRDALHALLDGRLAGAERLAIEAHLATCARCRAEKELLEAARRALWEEFRTEHAPPGLEVRVRAALDREEEERAAFDQRGRRPLARLVWAAGWLLSVLLAVMLIVSWTRLDPPAEAARDFRAVSQGRLEMTLRTGSPAALERRLAERGLDFPARALDLEMMGWELSGGRVHRFARRGSVLFAYHDARGRWLVCQLYPGRVDDLPKDAERRQREGFEFLVYEREGVTSVFWQEGEVVYLLASDRPREELVQLAFGKAMQAV